MNRGRVGKGRGGKEMDGCPLTGRLTLAVGVLVFCLCKGCLCFLNSQCHAFREFINQLQGRARLLRLKAHARVSSGIEHEGGLLSRRVLTVVVMDLT
jgi:hypothetical protein